MNSYRDLRVWQRSFQLTVKIYNRTQKFPIEERYGITQQLKRAAISILLNIAEGYRRMTRRQLKIFYWWLLDQEQKSRRSWSFVKV